MYHIRHSNKEDIDAIMHILDTARLIMRCNGNNTQWINGYPDKDTIVEDIKNRNHYIVDYNNISIAVFSFMKGPDITYNRIFEGNWLDKDNNYFVIHRVGKLPQYTNVMNEILNYCFQITNNIRMDTHENNHIMQKLLEKYGFTYCGIIRLLNGEERLAYQRKL